MKLKQIIMRYIECVFSNFSSFRQMNQSGKKEKEKEKSEKNPERKVLLIFFLQFVILSFPLLWLFLLLVHLARRQQ